MPLVNNLKKQVDLPVWEWTRFSPVVPTAGLSCSCTADNQLVNENLNKPILASNLISIRSNHFDNKPWSYGILFNLLFQTKQNRNKLDIKNVVTTFLGREAKR